MKQCEFCHQVDEHTDDCPNHHLASYRRVGPLVLDIETLPLASAMAAPYDPTEHNPPANYAKAEAILGWHAKNEIAWKAKREKECSVNPRLGRIVCFGSAHVGDTATTLYALTEAGEKSLLEAAWQRILDAQGRVITWNGGFDLRFLVIRSLVTGVIPTIDAATIRSWFKKYDPWHHFDVKAMLMNYDVRAAGEGLDEWSKFFGLPGKPEGVDGSMVGWLYAEGQHDKIQEYCLSDVANTAAMYAKLVPFFGGDR